LRWLKVLFLGTACQVDNSELQLLYRNTKQSECSPSLSMSTGKMKCRSSMTMLSCTQVCKSQRPSSEILDGQCSHIPTILTSPHHITTCFVLWKKACEDTITPMMRHCIMPHASGCRGRVTLTRW
jgi:hypothetical protein